MGMRFIQLRLWVPFLAHWLAARGGRLQVVKDLHISGRPSHPSIEALKVWAASNPANWAVDNMPCLISSCWEWGWWKAYCRPHYENRLSQARTIMDAADIQEENRDGQVR